MGSKQGFSYQVFDISRSSKMKKSVFALVLCVAVVALAGSTMADSVVYSTSGVFQCNGASGCTGSGTAAATVLISGKSVSLTYNPLTNQFVTSNPGGTNASFGSFTTDATPNSTSTSVSFTGVSFDLTITQSVPSV